MTSRKKRRIERLEARQNDPNHVPAQVWNASTRSWEKNK